MDALVSILLFSAIGALFVLVNLSAGALLRPKLANAEKAAIYECGEPTIGSSWVQFDLRFYIVGLLFLVFDVEVALLYPWAIAWGDAVNLAAQSGITPMRFHLAALVDLLFFFGILMVGFAYLWRFGYLDWVRSAATTSLASPRARRKNLAA
jgi:NADH-quinone oxidoreductase subunit A